MGIGYFTLLAMILVKIPINQTMLREFGHVLTYAGRIFTNVAKSEPDYFCCLGFLITIDHWNQSIILVLLFCFVSTIKQHFQFYVIVNYELKLKALVMEA